MVKFKSESKKHQSVYLRPLKKPEKVNKLVLFCRSDYLFNHVICFLIIYSTAYISLQI